MNCSYCHNTAGQDDAIYPTDFRGHYPPVAKDWHGADHELILELRSNLRELRVEIQEIKQYLKDLKALLDLPQERMGRAVRWEYKVVPKSGWLSDWNTLLNGLGAQEWELTTVDDNFLYFKRPIHVVKPTADVMTEKPVWITE